MVLARESTIGALDLLLARSAFDAEYLVVVLVIHDGVLGHPQPKSRSCQSGRNARSRAHAGWACVRHSPSRPRTPRKSKPTDPPPPLRPPGACPSRAAVACSISILATAASFVGTGST